MQPCPVDCTDLPIPSFPFQIPAPSFPSAGYVSPVLQRRTDFNDAAFPRELLEKLEKHFQLYIYLTTVWLIDDSISWVISPWEMYKKAECCLRGLLKDFI